MNMIDIQEKLKDFSEDQLVREMQAPTGIAPQFLVLSEMTRRKRMRESMQPQDTGTTVAEEVVSAAGVPQGGIATMAQALAPKSSMAQNTGASPMPMQPEPVQGMYGGGYVQKMQDGGIATLMANPAARAYAEKEAQRLGITLEQYLQQAMPPGTNKMLTDFANRTATRDRMLGFESAGDGITFPTQMDLDRRFAEDKFMINTRPMQPPTMDAMPTIPSMEPSVDLDLTTPSLPSLTALPDARPSVDTASPTDLLLGQQEYGFEPYSDQGMTAAELLAMSAGPSEPLPVRPEGGGMLPSGRMLDEYAVPGAYGNEPLGGVPDTGTSRRQMAYEQGRAADANDPLADFFDPIFGMIGGRTVEEQKAIDAERAARDAERAAESVTVQTADETTPRPRKRPDGGTDAEGGVPAVSDSGVVDSVAAGGNGQSGGAMGVGSGGTSGPFTSYEQELMDAMKRADRRAEQDKWLSLAQVGLNLMASKQPTLGGAIGEAGMAGLGAFQQARNTAEEERLGLSKALYDIQASREAAMAAQRAAGARAAAAGLPKLSELEDYYKAITVETKTYDDQGNEVTRRVARNPKDAGAVAQLEDAMARMAISRVAPMM